MIKNWLEEHWEQTHPNVNFTEGETMPVPKVTQIHRAKSSQEAFAMANKIVTVYKDFGWEVNVEPSLENDTLLIVSTMHNGGKKYDRVTWIP